MQCLDGSGKPKRIYYREMEALEVAKYEQEERGVKLRVYKCDECQRFHLTKQRNF